MLTPPTPAAADQALEWLAALPLLQCLALLPQQQQATQLPTAQTCVQLCSTSKENLQNYCKSCSHELQREPAASAEHFGTRSNVYLLQR
jgi:hypothetical protein